MIDIMRVKAKPEKQHLRNKVVFEKDNSGWLDKNTEIDVVNIHE